jgi:26S proteasome regulatory subunit N10
MKKNNVAIDFVNFGEVDTDNTTKLQVFVDAINSADNSHLATIPPGPHLLSDLLVTTPILSEAGGASSGGAGEGAGPGTGEGSGGFDFGVDPSLDPELALALRMSMEDEKARLAKEQKEKEDGEGKKEGGEASGSLEGIKEEDENTPLLKKKEDEEGGSGSKDDDKMDTA